MTETKCNSCSFEWYYKKKSDSEFSSTKNTKIRELNTPPYVFIMKKNSLDYNEVYTFKVKGSRTHN